MTSTERILEYSRKCPDWLTQAYVTDPLVFQAFNRAANADMPFEQAVLLLLQVTHQQLMQHRDADLRRAQLSTQPFIITPKDQHG